MSICKYMLYLHSLFRSYSSVITAIFCILAQFWLVEDCLELEGKEINRAKYFKYLISAFFAQVT